MGEELRVFRIVGRMTGGAFAAGKRFVFYAAVIFQGVLIMAGEANLPCRGVKAKGFFRIWRIMAGVAFTTGHGVMGAGFE